jgi:hypothetical protein
MTLVHWTQDGLAALVEGDGHGDTCGPIVMLDYLHILHGVPLTYAQTDALRTTLIHAGLFTAGSGMTCDAIVTALTTLYGLRAVHHQSWDPNLSQQVVHDDLLAASLARLPVILEPSNASALPDNQKGIQNHFILTWGIDSVLGYYTCNGDTLTGLRNGPVTSPVWYTWANLTASAIHAYAILPGSDVL